MLLGEEMKDELRGRGCIEGCEWQHRDAEQCSTKGLHYDILQVVQDCNRNSGVADHNWRAPPEHFTTRVARCTSRLNLTGFVGSRKKLITCEVWTIGTRCRQKRTQSFNSPANQRKRKYFWRIVHRLLVPQEDEGKMWWFPTEWSVDLLLLIWTGSGLREHAT